VLLVLHALLLSISLYLDLSFPIDCCKDMQKPALERASVEGFVGCQSVRWLGEGDVGQAFVLFGDRIKRGVNLAFFKKKRKVSDDSNGGLGGKMKIRIIFLLSVFHKDQHSRKSDVPKFVTS
jgi:hypothetical protein